MTLRCSYAVEIFFGPIPFLAKAYSVATEKTVTLSQVHAPCGGKLEQQYYCAADATVVPRPAIARQLTLPDGTPALLTEETIKSAESDRFGQLHVVECVPEDGIDPLCLGKTLLLGPDDSNIDAYAIFVDTLEETKTAAIGVYYGRGRDQLMVIQRYKERGLVMREVFYASEMRPVDELEFPVSSRASLPPGGFALWTTHAERLRKPSFDADAYTDGYPARLLSAAQQTAAPSSSRADAPTPLLKAARRKAVTGSTKPAASDSRERASVHALPTRSERETDASREGVKKRGT